MSRKLAHHTVRLVEKNQRHLGYPEQLRDRISVARSKILVHNTKCGLMSYIRPAYGIQWALVPDETQTTIFLIRPILGDNDVPTYQSAHRWSEDFGQS